MRPREEVQLARKIDRKWGIDNVKNDEDLLRELYDAQSGTRQDEDDGEDTTSPFSDRIKAVEGKNQRLGIGKKSSVGKGSENTFDEFKAQLNENVQSVLQSNLQTFLDGKFSLFFKPLEDNLQRYIHEENSELWKKMSKGPHDRIRNKVRSIYILRLPTHDKSRIDFIYRISVRFGRKWQVIYGDVFDSL